jgi:hypothetical protein
VFILNFNHYFIAKIKAGQLAPALFILWSDR